MKRSINVEVKLRAGESQEKLLRRFLKQTKKQDVIKEYLNRVSFFKTKKEKRKEKEMKNKWLKNRKNFSKKP